WGMAGSSKKAGAQPKSRLREVSHKGRRPNTCLFPKVKESSLHLLASGFLRWF
ncbi:MAG: hypothetical protein, partial [Olavius algarvensis spirochete endosymbiont]